MTAGGIAGATQAATRGAAGKYGLPNHLSSAPALDGGGDRGLLQYPTSQVPDFEALQEANRRKVEKYKFEHRQVTEPEPFAFTSSRRAKARAASAKARMVKQQEDPTKSLAWKQGKRGRSIPSLQRPPMLAVPRSTLKARASHDYNAAAIQQKREVQTQTEIYEPKQPHRIVLERVRAAVSKAPSHEERIQKRIRERNADDRVQARGYKKRVQTWNDEARLMPLLMERSALHSYKTRSRQRALQKVQEALQSRGHSADSMARKGLLTEDEQLELSEAKAIEALHSKK